MLVPMASAPDGIENVKLMNNLSYLGAAENQMDDAYKAKIASPSTNYNEEGRRWLETIGATAAQLTPLLQKQVNCKKNPNDPRCQPQGPRGGGGDFQPQETDWSTYLLIGGGVLLGGIVLYQILGKKKSRK